MKNRCLFLFILLLLSCKPFDRTKPHARILLRQTEPATITTSEGYVFTKEINKKTLFAKLDSMFLSPSLISEVLKKINHPKFQDAAYIKSRTMYDVFENGTIDISIYINEPEFTCQLLDLLVMTGLEQTKILEKQHFEKEMDGYKKQIDSLHLELTKTDEVYRNEADVFEKNQLYKKMNAMENEMTELIEEKMEKEITYIGMSQTQNEFVVIVQAKFIKKGR